MKKGSQVTIFIIVGIIIISAVVLVFIFRKDIIPTLGGGGETNPQSFLDTCLEEHIKDAIETISVRGGYEENTLSTYYKGVNVSYLCYNSNYYYPCINQEQMLIQHLKEELHNVLANDVKNCLDDFSNSLSEQSYEVIMEPWNDNQFSIELVPKRVLILINKDVEVIRGDDTIKYENFKIIYPSRFYELSVVVQEIVSQEARFCNFEQTGFMLLYPEFNIDKFRNHDSSTIYTIQHRKSNEKFIFAVKGCVIPPGIG